MLREYEPIPPVLGTKAQIQTSAIARRRADRARIRCVRGHQADTRMRIEVPPTARRFSPMLLTL